MKKTNTNDDTGLFGGVIPEEAKDTSPELQAALDRIFPDVPAAEVVAMMAVDLWSEHPDFPRRAWQHEVAEGNVQSGYWEWVSSQCEQRDDEEECVHDWKTTRSYGATVGYDAECTKCGEETTFTPNDD